jgi:tRNA (guanine37-N1)-methyltransferase
MTDTVQCRPVEDTGMHFDILTLFPQMFESPFQESMINRAIAQGLVSISIHNIRDYATDKHHMTDDTPYAGGGGMIMKPEPIFEAVEAVLGPDTQDSVPVLLLSPQGRLFTQEVAWELAAHPSIVLICGHYEGVDERVRQHLVSDEISIGDYVLTGGEIPAMVIVDAVSRLIPGVLGDPKAAARDSHADGLLEHPHYTRPAVFKGHAVPEVLVSGNHAAVALWRRQQALRRTFERRPDLLESADLTEEDLSFLQTLKSDSA